LYLPHAFSGLCQTQKCILAGAPSLTPLGELSALPQIAYLERGGLLVANQQRHFRSRLLASIIGLSIVTLTLSTPISRYTYGQGWVPRGLSSGVVSGTTVRALVLGRFSQKKLKKKIKRYCQKTTKIFHILKGAMLWAADVCSPAAFIQPGPVSSISLGRFSQLEDRVSLVTGFVCHLGLSARWKYQPPPVCSVPMC